MRQAAYKTQRESSSSNSVKRYNYSEQNVRMIMVLKLSMMILHTMGDILSRMVKSGFTTSVLLKQA